MNEPCIKGMTLLSVVEDVRRLRDAGHVSDAMLEARLEPLELAWLDEKIQPALWYPVTGYARLTQVLLEVEGGGDPAYLVRRGAAAAERLFQAGHYIQLEHGEKRGREARSGGREFSERDGRLMITLSGSVFNFGQWSYRVEGDEAVIEVTAAAALPEVSRLAAQGLIGRIASRVRDREIEVESSRPEPDLVVFRFPRG